jgi:hypothetical protein
LSAAFLSDLHAYGIDLFLHQLRLDTTTPSGRMMFQILGVFAGFERAMIRERVKSGLERARAQGKTLGRKRIDARKEAAILALFVQLHYLPLAPRAPDRPACNLQVAIDRPADQAARGRRPKRGVPRRSLRGAI